MPRLDFRTHASDMLQPLSLSGEDMYLTTPSAHGATTDKSARVLWVALPTALDGKKTTKPSDFR
jgi:hypothetical protein